MCPPDAIAFTNVINWLTYSTTVRRYDLHPGYATSEALARGPKAAPAPHATGKLLIAAALAVAALAAVGMSEAALAQTSEIKIGILSASCDTLEAGPIEAMNLAKDAWNADAIPGIDTELKLKVIDIRGNFSSPDCFSSPDYTDPDYYAFVTGLISDAVQDGYHFVAPSDDRALLLVHQIVSATPGLSNTLLVSPASQGTFDPSLYADDNLFRLAPNATTQALNLVEQFHRQGVDKLVIITNAEFVALADFPDDLHEHYVLPPFPVYGPAYGPEYTDQNVQSLTELNDKLVGLIDQYGEDRVGVLAAPTQDAFVTMANVLADNSQLDAVYDVRWFGYNHLGHSFVIIGDPVAAAFADAVDMNVVEYIVSPNEINAPLAHLQAFSPGFRNYNFASYDAVHLLADAIAVSRSDNLPLKDAVLEVANNDRHPVSHMDRILGVGAIGDYMLNPATGDLVESRQYVTYEVVQSGGVYVWEEVAPPSVCR